MLHGYGYVEFGWGLLRLVIYFLAAMRQDMSLDLYAMVKNVSTVKKKLHLSWVKLLNQDDL
jgi:hypothetical protein